MKILITGKNSYIGRNLRDWLINQSSHYHLTNVSLRNEEWRNMDFSVFDAVVHVAGIVHKRESPEEKEEYYRVNRDLTIELALKAKAAGVKRFIFMSTMAVYGLDGEMSKSVVINENTLCKPTTYYGKSKLSAEQELVKLSNRDFKVIIIRAPMIYGPGCPGNYQSLRRLVLKWGVLPQIENERSMLFIDNLSEFIRLLLEDSQPGRTIFCPQDQEYVSTVNLGKEIAMVHNRQFIAIRGIAAIMKLFLANQPMIRKAFGNLVYDTRMTDYYNGSYRVASFVQAVRKTELVSN